MHQNPARRRRVFSTRSPEATSSAAIAIRLLPSERITIWANREQTEQRYKEKSRPEAALYVSDLVMLPFCDGPLPVAGKRRYLLVTTFN
jgi:hypothetical protein